jgi:pyridoxal phosphate enzyme (YggS family)
MNNEVSDRIRNIVKSVPPGVTIIAVTKTFPFAIVRSAVDAGLYHIGENRVKEAGEKIRLAHTEGLNTIIWHMIGKVQSRKIKSVVGMFDRVDSVDSLPLLRTLDREAGAAMKKLHILLEVNVSGEESKTGFPLSGWEDRTDVFELFTQTVGAMEPYSNIQCDGIMTMGPFVINPELNRTLYRSVKRLSDRIRVQYPWFGPARSMGTSCDWQVAIEEGATEVRLGEALFGKRGM